MRKKKRKSSVKKQMLNTTIQEDVLNAYKRKCRDIGCPMNFILEKFMIQFVNDDLKLIIGDNDMTIKVNKGEVDD